MSFVRNYSDNQSPGDADSGIDSRGKVTQINNQDINPKVADSFVRNFSDNQSPGDGDAPNAAIAEEPGRLFGASEPFTGRAIAEEAAQKLTPSGKGGRDWIEEKYHEIQDSMKTSSNEERAREATSIREDIHLQ